MYIFFLKFNFDAEEPLKNRKQVVNTKFNPQKKSITFIKSIRNTFSLTLKKRHQ